MHKHVHQLIHLSVFARQTRAMAVTSSSESVHSSDSACATPELSRPRWAQALTFTAITKETKTTLYTGTLSKSLLDQVSEYYEQELIWCIVLEISGLPSRRYQYNTKTFFWIVQVDNSDLFNVLLIQKGM